MLSMCWVGSWFRSSGCVALIVDLFGVLRAYEIVSYKPPKKRKLPGGLTTLMVSSVHKVFLWPWDLMFGLAVLPRIKRCDSVDRDGCPSLQAKLWVRRVEKLSKHL